MAGILTGKYLRFYFKHRGMVVMAYIPEKELLHEWTLESVVDSELKNIEILRKGVLSFVSFANSLLLKGVT